MTDSSTIQTSMPRAASDDVSSWAENPMLHITRLALSFLQGLFEQAPSGHFRWVDDPERTEIVVTDEAPIQMDVVNKRPAIVTVRSPMAFAGIALDQLRDLDIRTGARVHTDMISGHITFNCLSRKKHEAELIGWLTARHLWILRRIFLRAGFHKFGENIQILAASPAGAIISNETSGGEILNVPVICPFHFQWTEQITPQNMATFEKVETSMTLTMRKYSPRKHDTNDDGYVDSASLNVKGVPTGTRRVKYDRSAVRPPHIRGRPISSAQSEPLPGGQPAENPLTFTVVVEE